VQWGETDAAGIVFYPNYFRWFDEATHELFRQLGSPIASMLAEGYAVPIIEAQGRFLAALLYEDELTLESRVTDVRTRAFRVDHTIRRGEQVVGEGYEIRMWVRLGGQERDLQPEVLPDDLRRRLIG
jgi:acyl-CoA thioester hydrolase